MEKKFYNITEVSNIIGRNASTIRFWETKFKNINPLKRAGGRRFYRPEDIEIIKEINNLLSKQGLTIEGAAKQLNSRSNKIDKISTDIIQDILENLKEAKSLISV